MTTSAEHAQKAFAALLPHCKDRHSYLKAAINYCAAAVKDSASFEQHSFDEKANLFMYPLKLACESKEEHLVAIALNAIQQLVAHGAVNASVMYKAPPVPAPVKKKGLFGIGGGNDNEAAAPTPKADANAEALPLVAIIVGAVCLNASSTSEEVQVRVVRNLLMIVSYPDMGMHGRVLLNAINTSYNVFLIAKSVSVQATAKAALSQMIGIVQQRAEAECEDIANGITVIATSMGNTATNVKTTSKPTTRSVSPVAAPLEVPAAANDDGDVPGVPAANIDGSAAAEEQETANAEKVAEDAEPAPSAPEGDATEATQGATETAPEGDDDTASVRTATTTTTTAASPPNASIAERPHTVLLLEDGSAGDDGTEFGSESERDCFVILRSLSKLSAKVLEGDSAKPDAPDFRGKLQALNMLYHFIMTVGPNLKTRRSFRFALRQYVARSLLESCMSPSIEIARVALNTMQRLACDYRSVLQKETSVFFYNILFPVLESSNSSFEHRFIALQIMESVLVDAQAVMDLFVNYDCVVGGTNLVSELVNRLSKASQTSHVTPNWITPKQDGELRIQAVRTLSAMTAAIVEWVHVLAPPTPVSSRPRAIGMVTAGDSLGSPSGVGGSSDLNSTLNGDRSATDGGDSVNRMISNKRAFDAVTEAFNRKGAKAGIALALSEGLLKDESATEIATFLTTKGFDKVRIGEYLSPNKPQVKEVLKEFIHLFNFSGLEIDEAMRVFLGKFKIQGEAETVDRTMELFAQRYCEQNPAAFSSPGTAYVLAFSIMMLNTDAHSVHVKEKMQLADFLRTLRGIDDGKDLPQTFLEGVYSRITTREIKLEGEATGTTQRSQSLGRDQKTDKIFISLANKKAHGYKRETDSLVKTSLAMLTDNAAAGEGGAAGGAGGTDATVGHGGEFITADHPSIAKAFWDVAWTAVLPSLSFPMEESTNMQLIDCCLEGFDNAMALTCTFNDATQREAFLGSLYGFTHLTNTKEMGYKNIKSIVTLMRVASREGDALEASWYDVLKCISSLDKLHILSVHHGNNAAGVNGGAGNGVVDNHRRSSNEPNNAAKKHFEVYNAEIVSAHFDSSELDRIFSHSVELSGSAVVFLIESLCRISAEELAESTPRTYSLQKLVEVAELNIGRMRYVWSQMWVHLSKHFISAGCNRQQLVAMYVVDGLRQLSIKFLARDELGSLGFQRDFMKPFEVIATNTSRADIRELVIASLGQMIDAKASNIMSGWHSVLTTLGKCSSASEHSVVFAAAEVLHRITLRRIFLLNTTDLLTDIINAWSMFGGNNVDKHIASCAIRFIRLLGTMANKGLPQPDENASYYEATADLFGNRKKAVFITTEQLDQLLANEVATVDKSNANTFADFRTWLSVFAALSSLTSVSDHQIRLEAVMTLFAALTDHALVFSGADWEMITGGTVLPIFENIFCDIGMLEQDRQGRTATTPQEEEHYRLERKHHIRLLEAAFECYTRLYMTYHRELPQHLQCVLDILLSCSNRNDPQVTNAGQGKLQIIMCSTELDLNEQEWKVIATSVSNSMAEEVQIVSMLESSLASNRVHEATSTVHALVRTLMTVSASLQNPKLPTFVTLAWLKLFLQCHRCACKILDSPPIASSLRKVVTGRIVLDLQREACRGLVKCFGKVPVAQQLEIEKWVSAVIRRFSHLGANNPEFAVIHEVVLFLLRFMCDMPDEAFRSLFLSNYGGLCALINNSDALIRKCLSAAFLRLGNVLNVYQSVAEDASTMVLPEAPDLNTTIAPTTISIGSASPSAPAAAPAAPKETSAAVTRTTSGAVARTPSRTSANGANDGGSASKKLEATPEKKTTAAPEEEAAVETSAAPAESDATAVDADTVAAETA